MFKGIIPSCLELDILEYANYCPKCNVYGYHSIGICGICEDSICRYEDIWKYNSKLICKNCIKYISKIKRVFTFECVVK